MKVSSIVASISILIPMPLMAEPYAEWGVLKDGRNISEIETSMKMPDSSEIPVPRPPGSVLVSVGGSKFCTVDLRSTENDAAICDFYEAALLKKGYDHVDFGGMDLGYSCVIFKDGDMDSNVGVTVGVNKDDLFSNNGSTSILIGYISSGDDC